MKARDLLQDALVDIGAIGARETMSATAAQIGLRALNRMLDGWQAKRLLVPSVTEVVATVSAATATIGTGMTFNCPAPVGLQRGCYYLTGSTSFPLEVWDREAFNSLTFKSMSGRAEGVYFDRAAGMVHFWPVTTGEYHLQVLSRLSTFASLDTVYTFPDGYEEALYQSLRERLPSLFQLQVPPDAPRLAASARRAIKITNTDVPTLQIDVVPAGFSILTNQ